MRSVATQAGVSTGLVQHYFSTRSNLLHASIERMIWSAADRYAAIVHSGQDALEHAVAHVIPSTNSARSGAGVWYGFLALSVTDVGAAEILARAKHSQELEVARQLVRRGCPSDPDTAARRLIGLADGLAARVLIGDIDAFAARAFIREEINATLDE